MYQALKTKPHSKIARMGFLIFDVKNYLSKISLIG